MKVISLAGVLLMATALTAENNQPSGLLCNLLAAPEKTEISDPHPKFSWIYNSTRKNDVQFAWQILVATSQEQITADCGDVWDSGCVRSRQSTNIIYAGSPLNSNSTYYWKVRTWNGEQVPGSYSATQRFRTGQLGDYVTAREPLMQRRVESVRLAKKKRDHYFFDFGKAAFGTVELLFSQPHKGGTMIVHLGEKLADSTTIDRKPGGTIRYRKIKTAVPKGASQVTVIIPPDKRNTGARAIKMPPEIGEVIPFRYCEIEKCPIELDEQDVTMIAVNYPFDDNAAFFECSDPVLNDVWELCKYSIKATSFCGVYVDGDRERIPYEADAYINQLCHYGVDREYAMARYSHEYLIKNATWPTEWILHSVLMAWADYQYTGNTASISHYYDDLKAKTLLALALEDGLISTQTGLVTKDLLSSIHLNDKLRDIVDWPPGSFTDGGIGERDNYKMGRINTVVNAFHYRALVLMSRIAAALGKSDDVEFFAARAARVKESVNEKLYDPERGVYIDCLDSTHAAQHANMFPLALGLVPPEREKGVLQFVKSRGMACSVYGAHYLLEALYSAGEDEYALELMTARHDRSWPHMIYNVGTTITLEAWDQKYKKNLDWNHAWGAAPAGIIPRWLIGVQPVTPGFETFHIKPQIADLAFAKAKVPTIRGPVWVAVQQNEEKYTLNVTIPGNSTATVYVPHFTESETLFFDGEDVKARVDGKFLVLDNIGPGEHFFSVRKK